MTNINQLITLIDESRLTASKWGRGVSVELNADEFQTILDGLKLLQSSDAGINDTAIMLDYFRSKPFAFVADIDPNSPFPSDYPGRKENWIKYRDEHRATATSAAPAARTAEAVTLVVEDWYMAGKTSGKLGTPLDDALAYFDQLNPTITQRGEFELGHRMGLGQNGKSVEGAFLAARGALPQPAAEARGDVAHTCPNCGATSQPAHSCFKCGWYDYVSSEPYNKTAAQVTDGEQHLFGGGYCEENGHDWIPSVDAIGYHVCRRCAMLQPVPARGGKLSKRQRETMEKLANVKDAWLDTYTYTAPKGDLFIAHSTAKSLVRRGYAEYISPNVNYIIRITDAGRAALAALFIEGVNKTLED